MHRVKSPRHVKPSRLPSDPKNIHRPKFKPLLELLEDRNLLANGLWIAYFGGMSPANDFQQQALLGTSLLQMGGVSSSTVQVQEALDLSGSYLVKTDVSVTAPQLTATLQSVPGFTHIEDYVFDITQLRKIQPATARSQNVYGPFDYDNYLSREKNGEFPNNGGPSDGDPFDSQGNNNGGATGTAQFTQSETSILAYGNNVLIAYNDAGSNAGGTNKFTGYARSTDGGLTFTDGGVLPTNAIGDAGDPVLARDETTGRIYFSTLGFNAPGTIQMFRSDDNGATWLAPVNATPGGSSEDKQWHTVDNYAGSGNGNVYMVSRRFGAGPGIYFFKSTDGGNTFGPNGGTLIVSGNQGAFVTVAPDHSIQVYWYAGATIMMRKSTDFGATFGAPITVASGLVGGTNGDLALTGIRQGTATASGFRSNEFPHAVVNPVSGHIYVTFANNPAGTDKADIFVVSSTDGGATWSAATRVNDDATTTDQWQPTLAVTPDGGKLGIFYYSRQEDQLGNNLFKYYGRVATIAGPALNFAPSFAISDVASLPEFGRDSLINSVYMGDYDTAVATPGAFHVIWADNRDDLVGGAGRKDPNVYYEKIPLGLAVSTTVPAVGSIISTQPTSFTVNFSDPIQPASVDASDLVVNGIPATGFSIFDSDTVIFSYGASPVTAQGLQTMQIAAGSLLRDPDGSPSLDFTGTFRYDVTTLQVTSTAPPFPGGVFTLPAPLTYDVNYNEPVDPSSVQTSDLQLSGIPGAVVTGATVLAGNTTVRFTINGLTTEGVLTANIAGSAITDAFGNPGQSFSSTYEVDYGTVPYPTPLAPKLPLGSLIYDPTVAGRVNIAGDLDNFTLTLDTRQTLTLIVRPTSPALQPRVDLFDPMNSSMGFAAAPAAGQLAGMQTIAINAAGTYRFEISGVGGTIGDYTVQVILNAAFELEGNVVGANNDTLAAAQSLASSFFAVQTPTSSASRGAVLATSDNAGYSAAAISFAFEDISSTGTVITGLTNQDDASVSVPVGFSFPFYGTNNTAVFVGSNGSLVFGSAFTGFGNTDLTASPAQAAIMPFWDDQHTGGGVAGSNVYFLVSGSGANQHLTIQWNNIRFFSGGTAGDTITYQAQLYADGRIQFNYQDLVSGTAGGNNGASATVGIKAAGAQGPNRLLLAFNNGPNTFVGTGQSTLISPPNPTADYYSFPIRGGQYANIALTAQTASNLTLELRDNTDTVVATGVSGYTNLTQMISNFQVPATTTYYLRVAGASNVPYSLVIGRDTAIDAEGNDTLGAAQPTAGARGVLGSLTPNTAFTASPVSFGFEDISSTGTIITGLTNLDDTSVSIPIGFNYSFYNTTYTSVGVSTNGLLSFGGTDPSLANSDLTTSPALASVAVFWDDLHTGGGATNSNVYSQVLGSGATERLVIQWNEIRFFTGGTAGDTITFQAVLFAIDGSIRLNYLDLTSGSAAGNNGAAATVGVKNAGNQGTDRLLLAFNNGPNTYVGSGQSTLLTLPPAEDWYTFFVGANVLLKVDTATPGDGPGEPQVLLDPTVEIYDPNGVLLASGVDYADGRNEIATVTSTSIAGMYSARVRAENNTTGNYFLGINLSTGSRNGPGGSPPAGIRGFVVSPDLIPASKEKVTEPVQVSSRSAVEPAKSSDTSASPSVSDTRAARTLDQATLAHFFTPVKEESAGDALTVDLVDRVMLQRKPLLVQV